MSLFRAPALFIASKAIPPVIAPSPITDTIFLSDLFRSRPMAMPSRAEIDVLECPTPKESYSLSDLLGNPERPLDFRLGLKNSGLPLRIVWPDALWHTSHIGSSDRGL